MTTTEGVVNSTELDCDADEAQGAPLDKTAEMDSQPPNKDSPTKTELFVEDEDVPANFFDDFLNNDFMDGLDVVDCWDDDHEKREGKSKRSKSRSRSRNRRRRSRSRSPVKRYRDKSRDNYRKRGRSRERHSRDRRSRDRHRGSKTDKDSKNVLQAEDLNCDHRRDPAKTKRDILKDKDTCAKNEISEKLKVVETGLVPPGTELEVDLNLIKKSTVSMDAKSKTANSKNRKSSSPQIHGDKKNARVRSYASRRNYRYSKSPNWRRSRSPIRYSRSPLLIRRRSSRRDYGTDRYRRRSRSIELTPESSSERNSHKPRSNRPRSKSRGVDFLEELANKLAKSDKKKYLNKIQKIIDHTQKRLPNYHPIQPASVPTPVPPPMPVPGPGPYFPAHMTSNPQYDHNFFIGQQFPTNSMNYPPQFICAPPNVGNVSIITPVQMEMPTSATVPIPPNNYANAGSTSNNINIEIQKEKEKEAIHKLFEDKKISLSDFLSMSAKPADSTEPINVQKKIKVISLCQDAIKILGNELQLSGRFFLKKTQKEFDKPQEGKLSSPLRKMPFVRFPFTTPSKSGEEKSMMQSSLSKLIASLGIVEVEVPPVVISQPSPSVAVTSEQAGQPVEVPSFISNHEISTTVSKMNKMSQTDVFRCQVCEVRNSRTFVNTEVQCGVSSISVGTQYPEDDPYRMGVKSYGIDNLKQQSLSHLTPAQLMRQIGDHSQISRVSSDVSPDKQNYRPNDVRSNLPTNDTFARQIFGFDKRQTAADKFTFGNNFSSPTFTPRTCQFENRPRQQLEGNQRGFDNRNSNPILNSGLNKNVNPGGLASFVPPRNTFPTNPKPNQRGLLPHPYTSRKF